MTDHSPPVRPGAAHPLLAAAGLLLAGAAALAVAGLLGLWVVDQVRTTALWRVEGVVAPVVVAVGVLAAGWVGISSLVAGACAGVRATGGAWRGGEAAVQRWAPGLVRRALAVAVAAAVGLGAAAGAHATPIAPVTPGPAAVTVDLGWTPTAADLSTPGPEAAAATPPAALDASPDALPSSSGDAVPGIGWEPTAATASPHPDAQVAGAVSPDPGSPDPGSTGVVVPVAAPVPGPAAVEPTVTAPARPPSGDRGTTVEVRAGDTLWGLAARALGPGASDAAIAAEWPRWYAANAAAIGPDPDVLLPGQVLVVPAAVDGSAR